MVQYLYLLWHTITVALIQAWLLYKRYCNALGVPKKERLKRRQFQAAVATSLIMVNVQVRRRGRPSSTSPNVSKVYSPRVVRFYQPNDVRYDGVGHLPIKLEGRGRCILCKNGWTDTACEKCDVRLCFNKERNCYRDYHIR